MVNARGQSRTGRGQQRVNEFRRASQASPLDTFPFCCYNETEISPNNGSITEISPFVKGTRSCADLRKQVRDE